MKYGNYGAQEGTGECVVDLLDCAFVSAIKSLLQLFSGPAMLLSVATVFFLVLHLRKQDVWLWILAGTFGLNILSRFPMLDSQVHFLWSTAITGQRLRLVHVL